MLRNMTFGLLTVLAVAATSQAALIGTLVKTGSDLMTNAAVYPGSFDTYAFQLKSDTANVDTLQLAFNSAGKFLGTGNTTFSNVNANPIFFGFTAPDTFFVTPPGTTASAGSSTDTANQLAAAFFASSGGPSVTLVPNTNIPTTVAFFSVPAGTAFDITSLDLANSKGVAQGADVAISTIPEPATFVLLGLAIGGVGFFRRRQG